jgi:mono/diheme cytochrome c family protein
MLRLHFVRVLSAWQFAGIAAALLPLAALEAPGVIDAPRPSGQVQSVVPPGEQIYIRWCAECHASAMRPGTQALKRKYQGQVPAILHERVGIPAELIKHTVRHGMGFMPPFRKTEISDSELDSLATYLSSVERDSANERTGPAK